ncbi:MAG: type II toxin-antitoxin system Phd/YefM family antitoxin [Pseudomonadota bacterium]
MSKVVTATEAKNRFGELLDDAKREPVIIQKNGRDQVVMLSVEEYRQIVETSAVNPSVRKSLDRSLKQWDKLYTTLAK